MGVRRAATLSVSGNTHANLASRALSYLVGNVIGNGVLALRNDFLVLLFGECGFLLRDSSLGYGDDCEAATRRLAPLDCLDNVLHLVGDLGK